MKVFTKIIIILLALILVTDIASSFYFYNLSVARTKKDFLANDSALISTVAAENISTSSGDVAVSAKLYSAKLEDTVELDWFNNQPYEEVSITSGDGLRLVGYYLKAEQPSGKTAILAHGYSSKGTYMGSYAKIYYDLGYNVLLPDSRGHGKSEGNNIGFGWTDRKDFLQWIDFVISMTGQETQIVLHGVSMGGAAVLMTSGEKLPSSVKAVVSDCAYTSVQAELEYQLNRLFKLPAFPLLDTTSLLTKLRAGYSFKEASALEQVKKSSTPTLFIHGDSDMFVPSGMVYELYDACTSPKDIYIVQGAGHGTAFETDVPGYKNKIREFIEKYVDVTLLLQP